MNADDEELLRGRVHGHDHDATNPGPLPHQTYAVLLGGPLDGLRLDITGCRRRRSRTPNPGSSQTLVTRAELQR
ncbi:hypothetical protein Snoj_26220 [Streptomyces nojiriensis]|uniref:Uncharacterized protein n=1 Tax=Streptomyces nojiriensis TaxID=66374 RepID=A0ABQ3SKT5_9ACTN|nr:hypothetical protein [Streptomyces nojiriensis]QTI50287.1 hypothetical protein JYK04_08163 [Streptomyces nojiriensis]GGS29707.1 hypothetical protein GCM10010205_69820 [Streptomyces nojiriensis]GHI68704.1 hypothetical protein Snoj_26220 [Streptomyces nojiriensis]